jgi:Esterase-like activity of phytase/Bacterial Ig domain
VRTVRGTGSGAAGSGMRRAAAAGTAAVLSGLLLVALVIVPAASGRSAGRDASGAQPQAVADAYQTANVGTLAVRRRGGLLANDRGGSLQLISHTDPTHGSLTLKPDGAFEYVPAAGFVGDDTFTYTVANAVHLYTTHLPPLGTFGGVSLTAGGYGSSLYPVPGHPNEFYGLEDRGPNVSAPNGDDVEPIPSYDPAIGEFRFEKGNAVLVRKIPLRDGTGHPYSGLVNSLNPTGETIEDLTGRVLAQDPNGYDSEGLVAMPDGTFWVSDEYGPFVTHFSSRGRALQRLSPLDGSLPRELANRVPNRGLEGLTVTPNGRTLVAMMQSALQQPDIGTANAKNIVPLRIVTYDLRTHALHEYLYLLHDPKTNGTAVSEITALSNTQFLVDERDGNFPGPGVYKKLWKIDLTGATDVGPSALVAGATYDPAHGGLLVAGKTIEALTTGEDTAAAQTTLQSAGITPVSSSLSIDLNALLLSLDPQARFFSHDKIEGVAALKGGREIVISNDSDFGIAGVTNANPPWQLEAKISPSTGQQDDGEYLEIDMSKLPAATSTATVTIHVTAP